MQGSQRPDQRLWRKRLLPAIGLAALTLLGGCLPGMGWGDDSDRASLTDDRDGAPALNRSYKTNFLSFQSPSTAGPRPVPTLMPDSGPSLFAFSTFEARRPAPSDASLALALSTADAYEPRPVGAAEALRNFYAALTQLNFGKRSGAAKIVHLGGDDIVIDRFAGALREHLTSRFGNAGRGLMLPGLYPVRGVKIDRRGAWALAAAAGTAPGPFGISGVRVTSSSSDAWLRFTSAEVAFDWVEASFMTGPRQGTVSISVDGEAKLVPTRAPNIGQTSIRIMAKAREVTIRPRGDGDVTMLSLTTGTQTPGIVYSNVGVPGATAMTLGKWTRDFVTNDLRKLDPDLVILSFGKKEGFDDDLDMRDYEARLRLTVDRIRSAVPGASLLLIGPPDAARLPVFASSGGAQVCRALNPQEIAGYTRLLARSDERLGRWHAPPRLEAVRSAIRRTAAAHGAFYWDWAKYMGGHCSIHAWTTVKPPLAAPDHLTLTEAGNARSARALFAELMAGFDVYQRVAAAKPVVVPKAAALKSAAPPKRAGRKRQ
ncbi:hypothetical protein KKP04_01340 [Rhodomicrobium sp. Az07]|uniref:GDSL-type esterase/lipase family protein n=1 Tax=Rhodomicrobium sp. Az07 TaxID=2839034 RepID=UPI001BE9BD18|nr:GDSL-type esterase/lipase family protein [Rhodomicrobium sp. Az07]MBT3069514.1 hypothetical protein [Rhodomicrobium sp. Az07]